MNKSQTSFLAGGDPYLAPFSSMTDGQLRDPKQLVGLARAIDPEVAEVIVKLMAPIAPHWAEELWHAALGHEGSVHSEAWPAFDPEMAKADEVEIAVQVNGKVKARIMVAADAPEDDVRAAGLAAAESAIAGKEVKKAIVVPGRLVNIVAK